jgi:hypothetical protein
MTLAWLKTLDESAFTVIDKASRGKGWDKKDFGIGWARKVLMDTISASSADNDLILSLDADTAFNENYFLSVALNFFNNPDSVALSAPYFHLLPDDNRAARAILRYEIYMRYYQLNLWRIGSPYTFTALGSAMACPVWAYRAVGGMTPKNSGEDFYFLQKLKKYGRILFWNDEKVFPEARFSSRVIFGTGPAMIKGDTGDWSSYPIYPTQLFDEIWETYELFPSFYDKTVRTKVVRFLSEIFHEQDPFAPLRKNFKTRDGFVKACHQKFDGLRILQYVKANQDRYSGNAEDHLSEYMRKHYDHAQIHENGIRLDSLSFNGSPLSELDKIRLFLFEKEEESRFISALH